MRRAYTLAAVDASGRDHEFVIKAWANGTDRGVYCRLCSASFLFLPVTFCVPKPAVTVTLCVTLGLTTRP